MYTEQAVDATTFLAVGSIVNILLIMLALSIRRPSADLTTRGGPSGMVVVAVGVNLVFGSLFPLVLLGFETFDALPDTFVWVAFGCITVAAILSMGLTLLSLMGRPGGNQPRDNAAHQHSQVDVAQLPDVAQPDVASPGRRRGEHLGRGLTAAPLSTSST